MSPVRIIGASYVGVPATAELPPEPIKLTAMESLWVVIPMLQHVLLYHGADMPPFDDILQSLKSSLATTLRTFAPLAGRLVHLKDTGEVGISCSPSDGVRFVVAESDADIRRLAGDEEHDVRVLEGLVPAVDMSELPTAVLAVQATRFQGGFAVGLTVHHGVADGRSLWTFVEAWASACRGEIPAATPTFDRSVVKLPGGQDLASSTLRKIAPNLPSAALPSPIGEDLTSFTRRTFTLDAQDIQRLKQRIVQLGESHGKPLPRPPSAFAAIVALAWTSYARCKPFAADDDLLLFFFADTRDRLDPPVDAGYIGVCLTGCMATLPAAELRSERALAAATLAVQDEINKMKEDPVAGWNFMSPALWASINRMMNISGSPGFRAYQIADFGWGKPRRTENIRMNGDGQVAMMRASDGQGVQVSVSLLQAAQMDEFKSHFLMF
ncbi:phenolic glucoside malonyltransferase 2-like [Lolium rigidum]|uniref:phenolic glucoside malonyltransferase 2-like n=1 Tax=Lolium rigidum TaxID=89674 RepID=UPI001F5CABBC|nr:phenolic glucoside malonyltransferase 2-like [Lolium rigidum]